MYDETFDYGNMLRDDLPFETNLAMFYFRKVLVVSPRDMAVLARIKRVSPDDVYIMACSIDNEEVFPPTKGIVRAASQYSGWRIKLREKGDPEKGIKPLYRVCFYSEVDFKISLFISKNVGPKSGNHANNLASYLSKNQSE